jgi:hypothetical protein
MAELNGKKYEQWEEYIHDKFPAGEFNISKTKDTSFAEVLTVSSKYSSSKPR